MHRGIDNRDARPSLRLAKPKSAALKVDVAPLEPKDLAKSEAKISEESDRGEEGEVVLPLGLDLPERGAEARELGLAQESVSAGLSVLADSARRIV